jgi:hypothetical protein
MRTPYFILTSIFLLSFLVEAAPIQNQKLIKNLKSSERWLLLPLVEDREKGASLATNAKAWLYEKEAQLQDLDLEIMTLSQREQKQVIKWWTQPFTSRLNQELIDFCKSLNCNLLTAYHNPTDPQSFTYVVYSLEKKRQLVFRSPQSTPKKLAQTTPSKTPTKKVPVKAKQSAPKKINPPESKVTPKVTVKTENKSSNFSEELQSWFSIKERPERTRVSKDNGRHRRSTHPEVQQQHQASLHKSLMKNETLLKYAKSELSKGESAVEKNCLDHLKQAEESWMSSTKFEHLSRAYVLNQHLSTPNKELTDHLLAELTERQEFLNSWDSDITR